ncbi:hypothetical protein [Microbacterium nymphoidis]|uniref:hypothetical protein n=1 Tax=Microbacterium nymphoidis TaxID=2898586 RepID=UPI001E2E905A|nr:hypothetical protein [Microbacterium nymphoidis]MCD2499387.1 hypothetical protein [Microbacterium nymphoidis]
MTEPQNAPQQPAVPAPQPPAQQLWPASPDPRYEGSPPGPASGQQGYSGGPLGHPGQPPAQPWPPSAHSGTAATVAVNTPWAWVISALAFVQICAYFVVDWGAVLRLNLAIISFGVGRPVRSELSPYVTAVVPSIALAGGISLVCYAASIVCAYLDQRALTRLGVVKPFPWGWNFLLQPLLYLIGRTVVLRRQGRSSFGPLWLAIAGVIASWIASAIVSFLSIYSAG